MVWGREGKGVIQRESPKEPVKSEVSLVEEECQELFKWGERELLLGSTPEMSLGDNYHAWLG